MGYGPPPPPTRPPQESTVAINTAQVQPWGLELDVVVDIEVHMTREVWKGEVNVLVKELRISMISVLDGGQMREVREPTLNRKQAEKGFRVDRMHMYVEKAISEIVFSACFHRGNF